MDLYNIIDSQGQGRKLAPSRRKPFVEAWEFLYDVTTEPTELPVTLAEARLHARIDDDITEDDALITALISAATSVVEEQTGRALVSRTMTAYLDGLPCANVLRLAKGRIVSVNSIRAFDDDGSYEELDSGDYEIDKQNARIGLLDTITWPIGTRGFNTFAVEYVAGYGSASDVPEWAKTCVKILVSHWYENREVATPESQNDVPFGAKMIMQTNKIGRI